MAYDGDLSIFNEWMGICSIMICISSFKNARSVALSLLRNKSTNADTLPAVSREYLTKWLGTDMAGSSYHERIVNASKSTLSPVSSKNVHVADMSKGVPPKPVDSVNNTTNVISTPEQTLIPSHDNTTHNSTNNDDSLDQNITDVPAIVRSSMVFHGTVRSGQQIYADGRSLVIVGSVNNGAEVLADGDIHVYGSLLGRAVAGLGGCVDAHIFARSFGASLVGISDAFVAPDDCSSFREIEGKEAYVRLLKKDENVTDLRNSGAQIVDCGSGNSLVMAPLS
jgi:septum site-determining protein MinC